MEYLEAREALRKTIGDITQQLPLLKDGKIQEFRQMCEPVMQQIQLLKDGFMNEDNYFDLSWDEDCDGEEPFAYVVFFSLAGVKPYDIFEDDDEFIDMLRAPEVGGEELIDAYYDSDTGLYEELFLEDIASFMQWMGKEEACEKLHQVIAQITENLPILGRRDVKAFLDACLPALYQIEELNDHFLSEYNYDLLVEDCRKEDQIAYIVYFSLSDRASWEVFADEEEFDEWLREANDLGRAICDTDTAYSNLTLERISEFMQEFPE